MNSIWLQSTRRFTSFFNNVCSLIKDSEAAASAVEGSAAKIADWASCLMGFYFTSAIAIALVSVQVQAQLPLMFHLICLSILLGFSSLLVAEFVRFKSLLPNQLLRCLSLFFLVLAFLVAISIPFPLYFKLISFIVFLAPLFLIFCFATILST